MKSVGWLLCCVIASCGEAPPAQATLQEHEDPPPTPAVGAAPAEPAEAQAQERARVTDSLYATRHSAIVEAAGRVAPAVVSVNVTRRQRQVSRGLFDFFLPREFEREVQGLGSGFIVGNDGLIITNQHVVSGAERIIVTTTDGTDYDAILLGEDPLTDIAVLKIEADTLPLAPIGISTDLMIGEWVVAIGNPYGYLLGNTEPTVTAGVVSGVGRNIIPAADAGSIYVRMIQTDAPINPGNSGGPLVNALGQVVGVNSSIFSDGRGSVGIGFAIPIERAIRVADDLRRHGSVRRAWVGVNVPSPEQLRDWKRVGGLEVLSVAPDSPASEAGIAEGDVLIAANQIPLRTFLDWEAVKLEVGPGDVLPVTVRRGDRERLVRVRVADLPTTRAERIAALGGLELITVTPGVRQERDLRTEEGALIYQAAASIQRGTGLREGDVITQINRRRITSADQVSQALEGAAGGWINVVFERNRRFYSTDFYVRK